MFRQDQVRLDCSRDRLAWNCKMVAYAPASIALKRVTQFVTISVFTLLVANGGNAADLPLPINATQREKSPVVKTRLQLFKEFLDWKKTQPRR
jgi:hypothetical protein